MKEFDSHTQETVNSHGGIDGVFGRDYWNDVSKGDPQPSSTPDISWWLPPQGIDEPALEGRVIYTPQAPDVIADEALDAQIRLEFRERMNDPDYNWEN
ncbi:MAG TPA: hypothetical protein VHT70_01290 [Candidatus Saccharimonadales bacterium]|jgi:hypothetical protein|nr:hypothetical protein [Candidatus Saccharimonadales bacterium]